MKYIYPVFVFLLSLIILVVEESLRQKSININYFSLSAYGSITIIMMLALFIVQKIISIREVYSYLMAGFTFVYVSLFMSTLDNLYVYSALETHTLEDLFRLVGFGFVVVAIIKWIRYNDEVNTKLIELASVDDLTGVFNRRIFESEFKREFANARRYNTDLSLVTIDLDNFKEINDKYGHFFGDLVLKMFTKEISTLLRQGDIFSRWGGDEFSVILPHTGAKDALKVAEKIRFAAKNIHVKTDSTDICFTLSLGVTGFQLEDKDEMVMMERTDKALYEAKVSGRDRSVLR